MTELNKQELICKHIEKALYELKIANRLTHGSIPISILVNLDMAKSKNIEKLKKLKEKNNEK